MENKRLELINALAYDMAKDEVFRDQIFNNEDEIRWLNDTCQIVEFHSDFKPIYDTWITYFNEMFKQYGF